MRHHTFGGGRAAAALAVACAALLAAGSANAVIAVAPELKANYLFPNGDPGFALVTHGGPIDPELLVGFNPQPDPPGKAKTLLDLADPAAPEFTNTATGDFTIHLDILGLGDATITLPPVNADGRTFFEQTLDGHVLDGTFAFGPGRVDPGSLVGFNPQPDPPGDVFDGAESFPGDPYMTFSLSIDGAPLTFSTAPEPATWAVMMVGLAALGLALRRRRATVAA